MSKPHFPDDDDSLIDALHESRMLEDAPAEAVDRLIGLWQRKPRAAGLLPRLAALLAFDSGIAPPLAYGMRADGGVLRQLLYSVEGCDVDLRIAPAEGADTFRLSGQVLGPNVRGVVAMQPLAGGERTEAALSELGEFWLPPVAAGDYRITLELVDLAIDLPAVQVPQRR